MKSQEVMRQKGATFFFATRFLPKSEVEDIAILYTFCRFVDDLVDLQKGSCQKVLLDLESGKSSIPEVSTLLEMIQRRKISLEPLKILIETLEKDQKGQKIETWGELLRYCYGVASTVGLMMCDILHVEDKRAYPFAIDLGIAMQLTNIARDIKEDAANEKVYLPHEALKRGDLLSVQEELLKLADRYYTSADQGIRFLPRYAQLTILIASRLYQEKGNTIRQNPPYYLENRADVSLFRKISLSTKTFLSFLLKPKKSPKPHDASLHRHLLFLPATNPP